MIVIAKIIMIGLVTFGFHCNYNFRSIGGLLYVSDFKLMLKNFEGNTTPRVYQIETSGKIEFFA